MSNINIVENMEKCKSMDKTEKETIKTGRPYHPMPAIEAGDRCLEYDAVVLVTPGQF